MQVHFPRMQVLFSLEMLGQSVHLVYSLYAIYSVQSVNGRCAVGALALSSELPSATGCYRMLYHVEWRTQHQLSETERTELSEF